MCVCMCVCACVCVHVCVCVNMCVFLCVCVDMCVCVCVYLCYVCVKVMEYVLPAFLLHMWAHVKLTHYYTHPRALCIYFCVAHYM